MKIIGFTMFIVPWLAVLLLGVKTVGIKRMAAISGGMSLLVLWYIIALWLIG